MFNYLEILYIIAIICCPPSGLKKLTKLKIFDLKREIGIVRLVIGEKRTRTRSKGLQAQTGISYPMHTTEIPILTFEVIKL